MPQRQSLDIDERVDRMEAQLESLANSMQRFADSMTTLVRMDERVAQILVENRSMGERMGRTQDTIHLIEVKYSALMTEVEALKLSRRTGVGWVAQGIFYVVSLLLAIALAKYNIPVG